MLDDEDRVLWVRCAYNRVTERAEQTPHLGREVLDGALIDGRLGLYCAIGEAVHGPGGYFGGSLMAFEERARIEGVRGVHRARVAEGSAR